MNANSPRAPLRSPPRSRRRGSRPAAGEEAARTFEQLRHALLAPDRERIARLETKRVDAESVASVLPEAIAQSSKADEQELSVAMEPCVTRAVTVVARRNPELYSDILAPTIGAATRKAVADALAAMLERFNETLERSLTVRSLQWRIEARRTGRPFAEIVLLRTLKYHVEQVFLIHAESSLVLQHLVDARRVAPPPPDQVAAMLSAIDSFGREAFGPLPPEAHLSKFELGELTILVTRAPALTLAAVVRGVASSQIGEHLQDALARLRLQFATDLAGFRGDVARFESARTVLEPLLRIERHPPPHRAHVVLGILVCAVLLVALVIGSLSSARHAAEQRWQATYTEALEAEPGIVVDREKSEPGRIVGLRDPLAPSPEVVLAKRGLAPAHVELVPFVSLDPRMTQRRAEHVLLPPSGVGVTVEGARLRLAGVAPKSWIEEARMLHRTLPGIEGIDDHELRAQESLDALHAAALETIVIPFEIGRAQLGTAGRGVVDQVSKRVRDTLRLAAETRVQACVAIVGHADPSGAEGRNVTLGNERAGAVAERLASLGVERGSLRVETTRLVAPPRMPAATIAVVLDGAASPPACGGAR